MLEIPSATVIRAHRLCISLYVDYARAWIMTAKDGYSPQERAFESKIKLEHVDIKDVYTVSL